MNKLAGEHAAAAITELGVKGSNGPAYELMMTSRARSPDGTDPYPAWLAANLIRRASDGMLFMEREGGVSLKITWDLGDRAYWYVAVVSNQSVDLRNQQVIGKWVLWKKLGQLVTTSGFVDDPSVELYSLPRVKRGDIVQIDIYRLPRNYVDLVEDLEPDLAIDDKRASHVARLPLPVVTAMSP